MEFDLRLFQAFETGSIPSTLRIYSWLPACISLGYSQKEEEEIKFETANRLGWEVVTRPTGGGIVFHNSAEVTYSLVAAIDDPLFPKGLVPSYKKISQAVVSGLKLLGINAQITNHNPKIQNSKAHNQLCFSYPAEYEIVVEGKKIVGSAQKRGKQTLLQQGSIFVRPNHEALFSALKKPFVELNAVNVEEILGRQVEFEELSGAVIKGFREEFGIEF